MIENNLNEFYVNHSILNDRSLFFKALHDYYITIHQLKVNHKLIQHLSIEFSE